MYISPDLLSEADWDTLAEGAKWARANAATLRDSHWIGGDPARGQVYGWASWSPGRAIVALRNPSDKPQKFMLDLGAALELPPGEPLGWTATAAFGAGEPRRMRADEAATLQLQPFEVLVWNLVPSDR